VKLARGVALCVCLFCGCTPLASVKHASVHYGVTGAPELTSAEKDLADAGRIEHRQPQIALGNDIAAAKIAANALDREHDNTAAEKLYNFAVARSIENMQRARLEPWRRSINVSGSSEQYLLTSPQPIDPQHDPSKYDLFPTDALRLGGQFFKTRFHPDGIGAPLVAIERGENAQSRQRYGLPRVYAPVTAVMKFQGRRAQLEFIEPFARDRINIDNHTFSLAADYAAPMAMLLKRERPDKLGLIRLLRPEKYADTARLIRLQPFDAQRTPVIFVHGLRDTPVSFVPMLNALRKDAEIQRRYQFWVFSYPSGYPYPYSGALLRRELNGIAKTFPNRKPIVLVGHSMGGMICRLMVTDAGDTIWRDLFGKSPAETPMTGRTRELLQQALVFNHRAEVKRVIFISTPHRGAGLASGWIGRTVRRLVKAPALFADVRDEIVARAHDDDAKREFQHIPNSIDTLSPNNRFVQKVDKLPITPGIPYNSIIGDRGRGDTPNSTDGVVPYWSSHLDGAQSELIVPSTHDAQLNPKAIAEVERILSVSR
jgi:pimeloyl-ACP methyl ester carboxylesterase